MTNVLIRKTLGNSCKYVRLYDDIIILYSNPTSEAFDILNKDYYLIIKDQSVINDIINIYYLPYKDALINSYTYDESFLDAKEQLIIYENNKEYKFIINNSETAKKLNNSISIGLLTYPKDVKLSLPVEEIEKILESKNILTSNKSIDNFRKIILDNKDASSGKKTTQLEDILKNDIRELEIKIKDLPSLIYQKKYEEAKKVIVEYIKKVFLVLKSRVYTFDNTQEYYYATQKLKENDIKWSPYHLSYAYNKFAWILNEEGNYNKAREMCDKAINFNPMSLSSYLEKAASYKLEKDFENMVKIAREAYDYIFNSVDLAGYYRLLGFYYVEVEKYDLAYACYELSLYYDTNKNAINEIEYIKQQVNKPRYKLSLDESLEILRKENIPVSISDENKEIMFRFINEKKYIDTKPKEVESVKKEYDLFNKPIKEAEREDLQSYFEDLANYSDRVKNVDKLITMLKNEFMKNLHITVEGTDIVEKNKFVNTIYSILEKSNKIEGKMRFLSLYNLGANNTYIRSDNSNSNARDSRGVLYSVFESIWKTKLPTNKLYLIEDIGEFIDDYKAFKSKGGPDIKRKQYEHALEILGDILEKNFIIINAKEDEIDRLFQIEPKLQFIYQNNRYYIPEITLEESYNLYINQIDDTVYDILKQHKEKYKKKYIEYISLNKNFIPFDNREIANYLATFSNLQGNVVFPDDIYKKETIDEALNDIVGLEKIKNKIKDFEKYMLFRVKAEANNIKLDNYNMHMIFTGNPGTGKTTIARIMAKMLYDMGVIKENKLVEVERKDLVSGYVGQTAIKTSEIIEKAMGGVLFIDEAYSLSRDHDSQHGFGDEAIETLIKAMEDRKGEFVVIFAGYKKEMADFIEANPGISSRIGYVFDFPDYERDELKQILDKKIEKSGLKINEDTNEDILKVMNYFARVKNIGNGRFVDKFLQEILLKHSRNDNEDILTITKEDIPTVEEITASIYNGENMINPDEISEKSLRKTAVHEVGHALVRYKLFNSPEIVKITINSEGTGVLGYVQLKQNYSEYTSTKQSILNNIMVCLAGMVSEEVFLGEFSNGNSSDLEKATEYAKDMIVKYGMSNLGYGQINNESGEIAVLVQREINNILKECFESTKKLIEENKNKMEKIVDYLYDKKEIDEEQFINIYNS